MKEKSDNIFYKEDWSTHFSFKNSFQKNLFFVSCVCVRVRALHNEWVPAVQSDRWVASHDFHSHSPLSLSPFMSHHPSLFRSLSLSGAPFSTGNASASSRRNRTARCRAAWRSPLRPRCSNTPSQSDKSLQEKIKNNVLKKKRINRLLDHNSTPFLLSALSVGSLSPKTSCNEMCTDRPWDWEQPIWFGFYELKVWAKNKKNKKTRPDLFVFTNPLSWKLDINVTSIFETPIKQAVRGLK